MSEISNQALMLGLVAGFLLGVIFFGGLWCTVRNAVAARRPALWFIGSMMLRISIVTWGFYLLLDLLGSSWKNPACRSARIFHRTAGGDAAFACSPIERRAHRGNIGGKSRTGPTGIEGAWHAP